LSSLEAAIMSERRGGVNRAVFGTQCGVSGHRTRIVLAFFAIYVLWGSTFLAIRIAVRTVPPLFAAGIRFLAAGGILYGWATLRGVAAPSAPQWRNLALLGVLMFLLPYGGLFWAEKTIPSGVASVLVATLPLWTALFEMFVFGREPARATTLGAIALGLAGVIVLTRDPVGGGVSLLAVLAIVVSEVAWALGTSLITTMSLPKSHVVTAAAQMAIGGAMLLASSAALGEVPPLPAISLEAAAAIGYQLVAGSLIAFTAYQWLLTQMPPTKVTSYAYVNPVVALVIGHTLGEEPVGARTIAGSLLVLVSTVALLRRPHS
jgi:drug/metabolite transporter (DMT)-like permease